MSPLGRKPLDRQGVALPSQLVQQSRKVPLGICTISRYFVTKAVLVIPWTTPWDHKAPWVVLYLNYAHTSMPDKNFIHYQLPDVEDESIEVCIAGFAFEEHRHVLSRPPYPEYIHRRWARWARQVVLTRALTDPKSKIRERSLTLRAIR